jgi:hypothetical protein
MSTVLYNILYCYYYYSIPDCMTYESEPHVEKYTENNAQYQRQVPTAGLI